MKLKTTKKQVKCLERQSFSRTENHVQTINSITVDITLNDLEDPILKVRNNNDDEMAWKDQLTASFEMENELKKDKTKIQISSQVINNIRQGS